MDDVDTFRQPKYLHIITTSLIFITTRTILVITATGIYVIYIYIYGSLCCPWARVTLVKFILQLYSYPHDVTLSKLPRFMYPLINTFYESSVRREDFAKMGSHWISFDNYRTLEESQARWKHSSHPGDIYMSYEHCGILHYMLVIEATLACRSKIAGTHTHTSPSTPCDVLRVCYLYEKVLKSDITWRCCPDVGTSSWIPNSIYKLRQHGHICICTYHGMHIVSTRIILAIKATLPYIYRERVEVSYEDSINTICSHHAK